MELNTLDILQQKQSEHGNFVRLEQEGDEVIIWINGNRSYPFTPTEAKAIGASLRLLATVTGYSG